MQSVSSLLRQSVAELEVNSSSEDESNITINLIYWRHIKKLMRILRSESLIDYWECQKYKTPILRKLAMILHGVPATQASVERAFPALKLILTDRRYNLSEINLEKILFVKLNKNYI